jgi:hypothetical protein
MRDPDLQGPCGRAWLLKTPDDLPLEKTAGVISWLVNRPGAHPWWQWWLVGVSSLRDIPGVKPAHKKYPAAEYEFLIFAIDPDTCPYPEPDDPKGYPALSPIDVVEQFHGIKDEDVKRLCEGAIKAILAGQVSPDQDHRSLWAEMIATTVQHFADGLHPLH